MWGAYPLLVREESEQNIVDKEKESWDLHLRSTKDVRGHNIKAHDGKIVNVEDFTIDDESWAIRYLVIDTKNWWGGKKVLISPHWIDRISWEDLKVYVNLSREIIKQSPEYSDELLLTRDNEDKLHQHYNLNGYWTDESIDCKRYE